MAWIGLALSYLMLLRASELFVDDYGREHTVNYLRGEDVAFYTSIRSREETAQRWTRWRYVSETLTTTKSEKVGVLVRMKGDGDKGAEAMELLQKLYRMYDNRSELPLMVYQGYGGGKV